MEYTDEEVVSLALENNERAKDMVFESNKYIVERLINDYYYVALKLGIERKELEQEAYFAFSEALKNYRVDKNTQLSTFIFLCVKRRLNKIIRDQSGEKAKVLNSTYSLDYDYNESGVTLKDIIGADLELDPLNSLTSEENYKELLNKIKNSLSDGEYEVFSYLVKGFDSHEIELLTNKSSKQIDNALQRVKHKIKEIIGE